MADPPRKRPRLSLKKGGSTSDRFGSPRSDSDMVEISKGKQPINTKRSTGWAVAVFKEWCEERNKKCPKDCVPEDILDLPFSGDVSILSRWLSRFVVEVRRSDGQSYSPTTLQCLLAGILRYMREKNPDAPNFLSKKDKRFRDLHGALETTFVELREKGIGAEVKHVPSISWEEENLLWESGVLGVATPVQLQRAVFFYVGKVFCLRGGQEQRGLKPSQFQRKEDPDRYIYIENGSKNNSGAKLKVSNKVVPVYKNPEAGERCIVYLLDTYLSKLPPAAFEKDIFYLRPKQILPICRDDPWYDAIAVGKEKLRTMVRDMCVEAGIAEKKTNHSLRAAGASQMFAANVPEKLIQSRTGHRSVEALRLYERPSHEQQQAVSRILTSGGTERQFGTDLSNVSAASHSTNASCAQLRTAASCTQSQSSSIGFGPGMPNLSGTLFGNMTGCTVNICPQNFVVNLNAHTRPQSQIEQEFDELVASVEY